MDAWVQMALNISKYGGIVLTLFFGIVGIVASYKEKGQTITRWGWTSIILASLAALLGLIGVTAEIGSQEQERDKQAKQALVMLHEIRRGQQPLREIQLDIQAQAPDDQDLQKDVVTDLDNYRSRLDNAYRDELDKQRQDDVRKQQQRWKALQDFEHGIPPAPTNSVLGIDWQGLGGLRLPVTWNYRFITPQSELFPKFNGEFWSYQLFSNLNTTFSFFKDDNPTSQSKPLDRSLGDLEFSSYLSSGNTTNPPSLAYDVAGKRTFTLSANNIIASSNSWSSNGNIISVEDLLGTLMAVRSTATGAPNGPLGANFAIFRPKRLHFRIADRDVYLSGQDFQAGTAEDGNTVFTYRFPPTPDELAKLRQPPKEPSDLVDAPRMIQLPNQ